MKKLVTLLKKTGVGFIVGNYQSYMGFEGIKNNIGMPMTINLSVNNIFLGEYIFLIEKITNTKVLGVISDKAGKPICPIKGFGDNIFVTLSSFDGTDDDLGTFMIRGPWGNPSTGGNNVKL